MNQYLQGRFTKIFTLFLPGWRASIVVFVVAEVAEILSSGAFVTSREE
jgi:hypothetical protein